MTEKIYESEYFSAPDTLLCGQVFRFFEEGGGFTVCSGGSACHIETSSGKTKVISDDPARFENYFDLSRDYSAIYSRAQKSGNAFLSEAAERGKGIRILRQDPEETLFSFIVSQNNNIPRIKDIIERLCDALGEPFDFCGKTYRSFPKAARISQKPTDFYSALGFGYRAPYITYVADALTNGFDLAAAAKLKTPDLKRELLKLKGVGPKVADCVTLFGFGRFDSFPVDTWMEKIYLEDMGGEKKSRDEISRTLTAAYGDDAGIFQQYLFHYKRNLL